LIRNSDLLIQIQLFYQIQGFQKKGKDVIYSSDLNVLFTQISRQYPDPKINGLPDPEELYKDPEYLLAATYTKIRE
jgi:hypothetical protein